MGYQHATWGERTKYPAVFVMYPCILDEQMNMNICLTQYICGTCVFLVFWGKSCFALYLFADFASKNSLRSSLSFWWVIVVNAYCKMLYVFGKDAELYTNTCRYTGLWLLPFDLAIFSMYSYTGERNTGKQLPLYRQSHLPLCHSLYVLATSQAWAIWR